MKPEENRTMNFHEFIHRSKDCYALEEGFALWKTDTSSGPDYRFDLTEMHSILLVLEGEMTIRIDDTPYLLTRNCFVDTIGKQTLELSDPVRQTEAWQLLLTETFLQALMKNNPPFPVAYVINKIEKPVCTLTETAAQSLRQRLSHIETIFRDREHCFQTEMLKCALWMFFLDISNTFAHGKTGQHDTFRETERKRTLFSRFIKLLRKHIYEKRSVGFYASELCVSPQYLNRIIKSISGKTAYEWIAELLTGEAYRLLADTDVSIQSLADHFNFPDQATFTKFFKRQSGISPTAYRRKMTKPF